MKNQVVELERKINQGLRNRQAIIENLKRQFEFLKNKNLYTESLPRTTNTKLRHEFVYKTPSIRNENDKGDAKCIEENHIKPIPTMPNPNLIMSYTNAKTFANDALSNHVGDKESKSIDGVGNEVLTKTKKEKDDNDVPKESNKEWKLNEKVVPHNENVYHYLWHPI
ncbi:hypothetical protein Tco_0166405, partial [Tanacetum coccineum]